ncbi:putative integral membrane protein (Pth11) [Aspergillus ruber CBS 135680]|uniref:Integral membrane protein n=1 Tax=Aspergillus ruber (strain CBS 135680) TaxID=1388766 RepID=A0A017SQT4_ASPRC|nr:uncharacterized protein EURHEDRAFT_540958 [Aspergillus ruber CBS 135680]EYE99166.1 integral membrane protein [Aspergillus ruber CBS 135680]
MDSSKTPAAPPPPGVTPNFTNPSGSEYEIYSVSIALCGTASFVLLARLYTRAVVLRVFGLDDVCCIFGQICAWIFAALSIANIKNGYGVHIWDLHLDKLTPFKKYDIAEEDVYALGVWFVKTSILLFYLRLSPEKRFRQMTYAIMIFVAVYSLLSILLFTLGCRPVAATWDVSLMSEAKCIDQMAFVYANAVFNIFSDVITLILPIKLCWTLQTSLKQKFLLLVVLTMGSFACVVAIIRIVTMMPFIHSNDFTWFKVTIAKWCMVEINVGIICACLPVLRPIIVQTFPRLFSSYQQSGDNYTPASDGSYGLDSSSKKRRVISWNHLTTIGDTQLTTTNHGADCDSESIQAIVMNNKNEHEAGQRGFC